MKTTKSCLAAWLCCVLIVFGMARVQVHAASEIRVTGNNQVIETGDNSPSTLDGTDFGSMGLGGTPLRKVFFIFNDGTSELTLSSVQVTGTGFEVTVSPSSVVAVNGASSFEVKFQPLAAGVFNGTVTIRNNDPDEDPFVFSIRGTAKAPDIRVSGNGNTIPTGDTSPGTADGTDFGSVSVGDRITKTYTIHNEGDADLIVQSIASGNAAFALSGGQPELISPGQSATFQLAFSPATVGQIQSTISITTNDPDENPYTFQVRGTSIEPEIDILGNGSPILTGDTTPSVEDGTDLGQVSLGVATAQSRFVVKNQGSGTLIISEVRLSSTAHFRAGFASASFPLVIASGGSEELTVTFDPQAAGTHSAVVTVANNDQTEGNYSFTVQGTALGASMGFGGIANGDTTPSPGDKTEFGEVLLGSNGRIQTYTVQNQGPGVLKIREVTIQPPTHFVCELELPALVPAGQSLEVPIRFAPTLVGTHTATVTVRTNDGAQDPFIFAVRGTATQRKLAVGTDAAPIVSGDLTPSVEDGTSFGTAVVGGRALVHRWPLRNTGNVPLQIQSVTSSLPGDFSVQSPAAAMLAGGDSVDLVVRFSPQDGGLRQAVLTIVSNDPQSPFTFAVDGTGTPRILSPETEGEPPVLSPGDGGPAASGDYTGGIFETDAEGNKTPVVRGGFDSFRLTSKRTFTAKGAIDGVAFTIKGVLEPDGSYTGTHRLKDGSDALIQFRHFRGGDGSDWIRGTLRWKEQLFVIELIRSGAVALPASLTGRYTMLIPAVDTAPPSEPHGDGIAALSVRIDGNVKAKYILGDGTKVSRSTKISPRYVWQFHFPVYSGGWRRGHLSGRLVFRDVPGVSDFDGGIFWLKTPNPSAHYYPGGFAIEREAVGSKYVAPPKNQLSLAGLATATDNAEFRIGSSAEGVPAESILATWDIKDKIVRKGGPDLSLKVDRKTGMIKGSYSDRVSRTKVDVYSTILQKQGVAGGMFKGYRITGFVTLAPQQAAE